MNKTMQCDHTAAAIRPVPVLTVLLLLFMLARTGAAQSIDLLRRDAEKEQFIRDLMWLNGLHSEIRVVIDQRTRGCAYATIRMGRRYIGYDPGCVGPLKVNGRYDWFTVAVLCHEVGHFLGLHNIQIVATADEKRKQEKEADMWAGWALYRLGATLADAEGLPERLDAEESNTHPGRPDRLRMVRDGWMLADQYAKSVTSAAVSSYEQQIAALKLQIELALSDKAVGFAPPTEIAEEEPASAKVVPEDAEFDGQRSPLERIPSPEECRARRLVCAPTPVTPQPPAIPAPPDPVPPAPVKQRETPRQPQSCGSGDTGCRVRL